LRRYVLERSIDKQRHSRRTARMNRAPRRGVEYSRGTEAENPAETDRQRRSSLTTALSLLAVAGGLLLIVATFLPVLRISVDGEVLTALDRTGWDEHGAALLALGLFALALTPAAFRGARPAAIAIALVGIAALAIAIASDLPDVGDTGSVGMRLEDAEIGTGLGIYAETLGGVLLLAAGGMLAFTSGREWRD
jgi:hypothetical protein